jgi:hypothetical protein
VVRFGETQATPGGYCRWQGRPSNRSSQAREVRGSPPHTAVETPGGVEVP